MVTVSWLAASFSVFRLAANSERTEEWVYYATYFVSLVWNLALLGVTVLAPVINDKISIPVNNTLLCSVTTIVAICVQYYWSHLHLPPTYGAIDDTKDKASFFKPSMPSKTYSKAIEDDHATTSLLAFEYVITNPLLVTTVLAAWSPDVAPVELQLLFVCMTMVSAIFYII